MTHGMQDLGKQPHIRFCEMSQVPLPSQASGSLFFPLPRDSAPQAPEMHLGDKGRDSPFLSQACRGSCGSSCCRLAGGPTRSRSACRCYASPAHRGCWPGRCRRGRSTCAAPASPRQQDSWPRARPPAPPPPQPRRATYQEGLVKLKQAGKLLEQLVDGVEPLQENGALLVLVLCVLLVAAAVSKLVPEIQPVRFHQHLETLQPRWGSSRGPLWEGRGAPRQRCPKQGDWQLQRRTGPNLEEDSKPPMSSRERSPGRPRGFSTSPNSPPPALSRPTLLNTSSVL